MKPGGSRSSKAAATIHKFDTNFVVYIIFLVTEAHDVYMYYAWILVLAQAACTPKNVLATGAFLEVDCDDAPLP